MPELYIFLMVTERCGYDIAIKVLTLRNLNKGPKYPLETNAILIMSNISWAISRDLYSAYFKSFTGSFYQLISIKTNNMLI